MKDLSVIIPSRDERYLQKTVNDILEKAKSNIEVIVILDGYQLSHPFKSDERLYVRSQLRHLGMRSAINEGMSLARGQFVMKLDEHCMLGEGFDKILMSDYRDGWVEVPSRYRLDPDKWSVIDDGRPPIEYMRLKIDKGYMHGVEWRERSDRRSGPGHMLDNTQAIQGSCWFMSKAYWDKRGPMDDMNYGPFAQEAQEIGNTAWLGGGGIMVNKKTWYAHWHKTSTGYNFTHQEQRQFQDSVVKGRAFSYDYWVNNRWPGRVHDFEWLMKGFESGEL